VAEAGRILADHGITAQYLALVDAETFLPATTVGVRPAVLLVAAQIGGTRLIDNVRLGTPPSVR